MKFRRGSASTILWINDLLDVAGKENALAVPMNFIEATAYFRSVDGSLLTFNHHRSTCEGGKLKKRGDIWEWTSTDVDIGGETYKAPAARQIAATARTAICRSGKTT